MTSCEAPSHDLRGAASSAPPRAPGPALGGLLAAQSGSRGRPSVGPSALAFAPLPLSLTTARGHAACAAGSVVRRTPRTGGSVTLALFESGAEAPGQFTASPFSTEWLVSPRSVKERQKQVTGAILQHQGYTATGSARSGANLLAKWQIHRTSLPGTARKIFHSPSHSPRWCGSRGEGGQGLGLDREGDVSSARQPPVPVVSVGRAGLAACWIEWSSPPPPRQAVLPDLRPAGSSRGSIRQGETVRGCGGREGGGWAPLADGGGWGIISPLPKSGL